MKRLFYANALFASCSLFVIPKESRCESGAPELSCDGNTLVFNHIGDFTNLKEGDLNGDGLPDIGVVSPTSNLLGIFFSDP
jgi:hypothetical protein